ncbi:hypothetical protein ABG79_01705 [Caloramator mitchellensis]|uniref:BMC domain-containing protein n=1 Tax=Caloramator mitchellensis TaxID=908809 RepID=A0A0R3JSL9_CALMK|nr:BMC domain-containing protein [Caloramator mitchellensis]KRQ86499.1 hypothetical protein ABG79_01705 [Caloramator mitchellensis]
MTKAIGLVELNSIAKGIETADKMFKSGDVDIIISKPICPGKFIILITGDVGAVKSSVEKGIENAENYIVDSLILPKVHTQVLEAINYTTKIEKLDALGILEFYSIATAVVAADAVAKTSQVQLMELRLGIGIGGKSFLTFTGDVSSINEGIEIGEKIGEENGMLVYKSIIPSPSPEIFEFLI